MPTTPRPGVAPPPGPRFVLLFCVLPIVVGGSIYLLFRDNHLLMFRWAGWLGLTRLILAARIYTLQHGQILPEWLLFSVPDGVWVFSITAFFTRLWHDGSWYVRAFWIALGPALAMGGELGQALGLVPGTYDPADLVFYGVSAILAFALAQWAVRLARGAVGDAEPG